MVVIEKENNRTGRYRKHHIYPYWSLLIHSIHQYTATGRYRKQSPIPKYCPPTGRYRKHCIYEKKSISQNPV
jgi:hypothetical protein